MKEAKPTFVLVSPYFLRNTKWVYFVAQHGSLILAIEMLVCTVLCNFACEGDLWIGYLFPLTFFTFFYIVNHDLNNEKLLVIQILSTYIIAGCVAHFQFYLNDALLDKVYFRNSHLFLKTSQFKPFIYVTFLQFVHRRFYTNDLSTPERILKLNKCDCYHFLICFGNVALLVSTFLLKVYFIYFTWPNDHLEFQEHFKNFCIRYTGLIIFTDIFIFLIALWIISLYMRVCHSNVINASTIDEVQYDSEGRAWCCVLIPASASQLGVDNCGSSISILLKQSCILPRLLFGIKLKTTPSSVKSRSTYQEVLKVPE